jgi:hypothetical protein
VSVAVALSQLGGTHSLGWNAAIRDAIARAAVNRFLISIVAGAAFSALRWKLPTPAGEIVNLLANAAGPCALLAIGVSLYRPGATQGVGLIALPVIGKLLGSRRQHGALRHDVLGARLVPGSRTGDEIASLHAHVAHVGGRQRSRDTHHATVQSRVR